MLTIFSCPKPFHGHIKIIQMNALQSWVRLSPKCEIILFGDEEGTAEAASSLNVCHVPQVARNEYGTPLLDDVFSKAETVARHNMMCYINADVILLSDIMKAVEYVQKKKKAFLMVGKRWNINLEQPWDFSRSDWEEKLRTLVYRSGTPTPPEWIDYFIFPRGFYRDLLPFALGRAAFDNWLLWKARSLGASTIDASEVIMVIHQNHDYSHHPEGQKGVWEGPEAKRNRELMGGWHHCSTLVDATHELTASGLKLKSMRERLIRVVWARGMARLLIWLLIWTQPLRDRFGLNKSNIDRFFKTLKKGVTLLR
jgi:hypothetical protein